MKNLLRLIPVVTLLGTAPLTVGCSKPADHPDVGVAGERPTQGRQTR